MLNARAFASSVWIERCSLTQSPTSSQFFPCSIEPCQQTYSLFISLLGQYPSNVRVCVHLDYRAAFSTWALAWWKGQPSPAWTKSWKRISAACSSRRDEANGDEWSHRLHTRRFFSLSLHLTCMSFMQFDCFELVWRVIFHDIGGSFSERGTFQATILWMKKKKLIHA